MTHPGLSWLKEQYADKLEDLIPEGVKLIMPRPKKFKIGDKVKFVVKYKDHPIGKIVTIKALSVEGYYIKEDGTPGYFYEKDFELVEEKEPVKTFKTVAEEWGF